MSLFLMIPLQWKKSFLGTRGKNFSVIPEGIIRKCKNQKGENSNKKKNKRYKYLVLHL